jgi:hypothetical protein
VSNIERLGLVTVGFIDEIADAAQYSRFATMPEFLLLREAAEQGANGDTADIKRGVVALTPFGHAFIAACVDATVEAV